MPVRATPRRRTVKASDDASGQSRNEEIARRAYEIFLSRGGGHGHDFDDWLEAEREVSERREEAERSARRES